MQSAANLPRKRTWERRLAKAKKGHRPSLKNWSRDGFATTRSPDFAVLSKVTSQNNAGSNLVSMPVVHANDISLRRFRKDFETALKPCIIDGIPETEHWLAATGNWSLESLKHRFGDRYFKCGEDDDGYKIKVRLKYFLQYLRHNTDDSPLYVFDGSFDNDPVSKDLMNDFHVPFFFPEDLFNLVGEKRRPPYRWVLIGPARSGSEVHIDPLGTSAWNTLVSGRKRWVLFPPGTPKAIAKGLDVIIKGEDDEAINYFVDLLPRIREKYGNSITIVECIQEAGQTMFVPGGWWHGVLNLTDTVAVTQNYCSSVNFDQVWRKTRIGRKKMAVKWLKKLREVQPELAQRAERLNVEDGFVMVEKKKEAAKDESNNGSSKHDKKHVKKKKEHNNSSN